MKIRVPEEILRKMTRAVDGRRKTEVEIEIKPEWGGLLVRIERTGEMVEWSRKAYEQDLIKIIVKRGKL